MFENLTDKLSSTLKNLSGKGKLTEKNIQESLREVRMALLDADVALPVVKQFIADIQTKAIGQKVIESLEPGQALIKIVHDELINMMGEATAEINLNTPAPAVLLMAGLQGSGKTTSSGKLAAFLKQQKKSIMLVSTDVYRPAAILQLKTLAEQLDVACYDTDATQKPADIAKQAIQQASKEGIDIVIVDTAGRLHIDDEMMTEIRDIHASVNPIETLFVVDSMTGQDAANTAKAFHDILPLTGVILTKLDGDARGGAALSIRAITGKPIKFIGTGEKLDALQPFHPDRIASRILGMGDVLSLIEQAEQKIDKKKAEKFAKKIEKGKGFDLEDFREQLQQMQNMGGMSSLLDKMPGMANIPDAAKKQIQGDKQYKQFEAMINSMTLQERRYPAVINGSRKRRIAAGSGTQVPDVNRLLKQFTQMQKMMKKFAKGGMGKMMKQMQRMKGMMPPGGGFPPMK